MAEKEAGDVNVFIQQYGPVADRIGKELDVDPKILLAQFGIETGYGKSIVPGTFNLGNIKSANKGVKAKDNATGNVDPYLKFEDADTFADYYVDYMKRRFPSVVGTGSDVTAFTAALRPGEQGGYAEDKNYGSKLSNGFSLINARMESAGAAPVNPNDAIFGVGKPTAADEMRQSGFGEQQTPDEPTLFGSMGNAALAGVVGGYGAGKIAQGTKLPTSVKYDAAVERLAVARDKLADVTSRATRGGNLQDLEAEFKRVQGGYAAAEAELAKATNELKIAKTASTPLTFDAPDVDDVPKNSLVPNADQQARGIQGTTKETGITGRASETTYKERSSQIKRNKDAQNLVLQRLGGQGLIDPSKAYALTEGISASTPSGVLVSPDVAAVQQSKLQAELDPLIQKEQMAREAKTTAGQDRQGASRAAADARKAQQGIDKAQGAVNVAQASVDRTPTRPQGFVSKTGEMTAKIAPKALGVISGVATGMAAEEAFRRFKKNDYSGAVLPTIEALLGVMSMIPPYHPIAIMARGIGTIGGTALGVYELGKAGKEVYDAKE